MVVLREGIRLFKSEPHTTRIVKPCRGRERRANVYTSEPHTILAYIVRIAWGSGETNLEDRTDVQLENVVIEDLLSDQTDGEGKEEQGKSHDSHASRRIRGGSFP